MPVTQDVWEPIETSVVQVIIASLQNEVAILRTELSNIKRENLNKLQQLEEIVADNNQ